MRRAALALLAGAAVMVSGCGSDKPSGDDGAATSTPAAILRSRLQAALGSQTYLTGAATLAGTRNGFGSRAHRMAFAELDQQIANIRAAVASAAGDAKAATVAARTTAYVTALDDYGKALHRGDAPQAPLAAFNHARAQESAALAAAGKGMTTQQVDQLLQPAATLQRQSVEQLIAGAPVATATLARAAETTAELAAPISQALAKAAKPSLKGAADGAAAGLRALLTAQLSDQAHLVGTVSREVAAQGITSDGAQNARDALRNSSTLLEETIGAAWGQSARGDFASIWRTHLGALEDYAVAEGQQDPAAEKAALAKLTTFHDQVVAFFVAQDPKLTAKSLQGVVGAYLQQATATTRAWASGSLEAYVRYQHTADRMPLLAAVLARGIAQQFPDQFGS